MNLETHNLGMHMNARVPTCGALGIVSNTANKVAFDGFPGPLPQTQMALDLSFLYRKLFAGDGQEAMQ